MLCVWCVNCYAVENMECLLHYRWEIHYIIRLYTEPVSQSAVLVTDVWVDLTAAWHWSLKRHSLFARQNRCEASAADNIWAEKLTEILPSCSRGRLRSESLRMAVMHLLETLKYNTTAVKQSISSDWTSGTRSTCSACINTSMPGLSYLTKTRTI